jgi:hypothetical protein
MCEKEYPSLLETATQSPRSGKITRVKGIKGIFTIMYTKRLQTKSNKFNAIKQTYNGYSYDSKKEAKKAFELDCLVKAKQIKSWTRQDTIELYGENGSLICKYKPDFTIYHNDGMIEILEIKSKATVTPSFRIKWKLLEDKVKKDPNIKLTIEY